MPKIVLGDIKVDVVYKDIKHVYLNVYPPSGEVRISAPRRIDMETLRTFAVAKLAWIREKQTKLQQQARESSQKYVDRENHYYLGKRYLLKVSEVDLAPRVMLNHTTIEMQIRPDTDTRKRGAILNEWYRQRLKDILPAMIHPWEERLNVNVTAFGIKRMKTKWGSCNQKAGRIWLNLELGKKPLRCLEYVVVHEMVHLMERKHGERFTAFMDKFMPMWRSYKEELNRIP